MENQSLFAGLISRSIGKKQLMAITGLLLCGFLITHLLGNLLLLAGSDQFNLYAHRLTSTPLIYVAEAGLIAIFFLHLFLALKVNIENRRARPEKYYMKKSKGGATVFSRTMPFSGLVILVFVILHLMNFKYGVYYSTLVEGEEIRDLYRTVIEYFSNPYYTAWYCFAMFVLAFHLAHGVQSSFQTLGVNHPQFNCCVQRASLAFALLVPAGFSLLAIWCYWQNQI